MFYRLLFCLCVLVFLAQCSKTPDQTFKIGVIVSGEDARKSAITHFVNYAIEQQNLKGGIGGKFLKAVIFDDDNQPEILEKQGKEIIADKSFIGVVGGWNSTRASKIIDIFGKNNMPYIGDFSNADLFSQYANIYTMAPSIRRSTKTLGNFLDNYDFERAIFIGREGDNYSKKHQDFIKIQSQYPKSKDKTYALCKSLFYEQRSLKHEELSEIVQTAQDCRADLIFLSLGSVYNGDVLIHLDKFGISAPAYTVLGTIQTMMSKRPEIKKYGGEIIDEWEKGIPNVVNERLQLKLKEIMHGWNGEQFSSHVHGYGARYMDAVNLILKGAQKQTQSSSIADIQNAIIEHIKTYKTGHGVYKGLAQDWSFDEQRSSDEHILYIHKRPRLEFPLLYPNQQVFFSDEAKQARVVYMALELKQLSRINHANKTFTAVFHLSVHDEENDFSIDDIAFTNAALSSLNSKPLINTREMHRCVPGADCPNKVFRIEGQFDYFPDLVNYPFDAQIFTIAFQPVNNKEPFFVQPPSSTKRTGELLVDGWQLLDEYIGANNDIITTVDNFGFDQRLERIYKFNFSWKLERTGVDFWLKVFTPLMVILAVAALSFLIPLKHFDAIITAQVTALLASVAFYFAIDKPITEYATISDFLFLSAYIVILVAIFVSCIRVRFLFKKLDDPLIKSEPISSVIGTSSIKVPLFFNFISSLQSAFKKLIEQKPPKENEDTGNKS